MLPAASVAIATLDWPHVLLRLTVAALLGGEGVYTQIGIFFTKMAVVTFGGAYAGLAYMAQQAVETYGWLKPGEMLTASGWPRRRRVP